MNSCPCCLSPEPSHIIPDGIWWVNSIPVGIAYRCPCGNNRSIRWDQATEELRHIAIDTEKARWAMDGLI